MLTIWSGRHSGDRSGKTVQTTGSSSNLMTKDEARRIAVNIAKLLRRERRGRQTNWAKHRLPGVTEKPLVAIVVIALMDF